MAINSIWNNNSPMDYLDFLSTDSDNDNNTEDNEWLTHFQQLVQEKLSEMNEDEDSAAAVNPAEEIAKWKENIYNKMKNGETEESFQIGGQSFSMKEWDKLLDSFDKAEEALQESIEDEEKAKDREMAETAKKSIVNDTPAQPLIDMLLSDTLKVPFPTDAKMNLTKMRKMYFIWLPWMKKASAASKTGLILTNGKLNLKTIPSMRLPVIS